MKVFYFSGPPGSGKSYLTKKMEEEGYTRFDELVEPFPNDLYPDTRSTETVKYVHKQMVKRDEMIRQVVE